MMLVQVSTSYFSVSPLLACLQKMTSVTLADEIVNQLPHP